MLGGVGWEGFRFLWEDYTFKDFSCRAEEGDGPVRGAGVWGFSWFLDENNGRRVLDCGNIGGLDEEVE